MAKRRNPSTSTDAYHSVRDHVIPSHHQKILDAMQKHGEGIYEEIAEWCGFKDKNMISRRLLELLNLGKIEKTERTKNTSSGRKAFIYQIKPIIPNMVTYHNEETGVTFHLHNSELFKPDKIEKSPQHQVIQQSLFKN